MDFFAAANDVVQHRGDFVARLSSGGVVPQRGLNVVVAVSQSGISGGVFRGSISGSSGKEPPTINAQYARTSAVGFVAAFVVVSPTATAQDCDPNYSGACVPIASDVDCAGGNGNGPAYVSGPVYVVGEDIYELDREGDGVACEPKD